MIYVFYDYRFTIVVLQLLVSSCVVNLWLTRSHTFWLASLNYRFYWLMCCFCLVIIYLLFILPYSYSFNCQFALFGSPEG